ncbi:hypothetical protein IV54_GL000753 [Levilactobacillus paucivorans]|uniref:Uncharacterized protein n=1 Tax=Levilactobacillus paucivorans TaxID=616990 RepID=A0A0R2LZJ3_9LACO|nr:DUF3278 domain-containing protein [Levilactobacillus paucivorans]KRO04864.1 hypothetical protein IV54_GL000753 [Levilactobacillus paucivorans]
MTNNHPFHDKFSIWFYGVNGEFDDTKRLAAKRIEDKALLWGAIYVFLAPIITSFFAQRHPTTALSWLALTSLFFLTGVVVYLLGAGYVLGIGNRKQQRLSRQQPVWLQAISTGISAGSLYGGLTYLYFAAIDAIDSKTSIWSNLILLSNIGDALVRIAEFSPAMIFLYWLYLRFHH